MIFYCDGGDLDQQGDDHLVVDEDVLEEGEALAPLDQLVQPLVCHHCQSLDNVLSLA